MEIEILKLALEAVLAKKAMDPVFLDMTKLTPIVDYFLVCGAQTPIQIKAIADNLREEMERAGMVPPRKEGTPDTRWLLLDYGWLVAHIMLQPERDFYQLERLWHDAERLRLLPPEKGDSGLTRA